MVGPTKLNPSSFRPSTSSATRRLRRHLAQVPKLFCTGAVDEIPQEIGEIPACSRWRDSACADCTAPRSWRDCGRCPRSCISASSTVRPPARDLSASNPSKAARKLSRLRRMVIQDSPAWKPSSRQLLEQRAVVALGHAPFGVVVGDVERVGARPGAAGLAVGMEDERGHAPALSASPGNGKRAKPGFDATKARPPPSAGCRPPGRRPAGRGAASPAHGRPERARRSGPAPCRRPRPRSRPAANSRRGSAPARCACAPCRDAACATRPPGRHSSPCRSRRRRAGPCRLRAETSRRRRNRARLPARRARSDAPATLRPAQGDPSAASHGTIARWPRSGRAGRGRRTRRCRPAGSRPTTPRRPRSRTGCSTVTFARSL